jgi:retron-type reverse transcriptase
MPLVACRVKSRKAQLSERCAVKTYNDLYEQVYDFENLYQAYLMARKNKKYREGVLTFSANLEENLINLQNHLMHQSYRVGDYMERLIYIPKKRIIMILPFRDRVLQWAIYRVVAPLFEKSYITDSYGCIKGRGGLAAAKRAQYWLKKLERDPRTLYVLMMDIRKYFFRVPHDVIMEILGRKIADEKLMKLFDLIINSRKTPFGLPIDVIDVADAEMLWDVGMPVGSLFSQMVANIVLNEVDQYVKRTLQVRHYIRYMDNSLIFSHDKSELHRLEAQIGRFLHEKLRLEFSSAEIHKASTGFEFVGYRVWSDKLIIRKDSSLRMKRRLLIVRKLYAHGKISLESAVSSYHSYFGRLQHCTNKSLMDKVREDFVLVRKSSPE